MLQIQHISSLFLTLFLIADVRSLANCPPGCQCDDNTLVVQCGEGQLDVLPIALNPSIQRLVIRSNKIKTIDSSIQFYAELTFLDLSSNHLMNIPQRTFAYQKKLQELHLNHNKIGQISNKTFIGLAAVTVLNLRGNLISELNQGTFSPLVKMEELNLGENRINFIDPKAFEGLTLMRILYLDDNALTSVPDPVIFQTISNLAELYLGMNTLSVLPSAAFQDIKTLTRLDLRGTALKNISHDSFNGLEALRILDLSDNRLQRIPTLALSHLMRLEELSLGQNDFEIIPEGAFVGLKQLKRLEINGALRLKRVMNGAFASNANLEHLQLSSNKMLSEVQEGAFGGLPHLRHIILKANALTTLAEGLFPWKDLQTLDISENPIACDCRVMWLRNLLLVKNSTAERNTVADVLCVYPERLLDESLQHLNPTLMGCSHTDPRKQALIGALLVGSAATITALALIVYRCRRKIREYLKGGLWGNAALGRKEREYQKTFCDEDYMTRHQHFPCSLGIHSSFPNTYTPHHSTTLQHHYGMSALPINDLNAGTEIQKNFQQLQVPTAVNMLNNGIVSEQQKNTSTCSSINDDGGSFVVHTKTIDRNGAQKLNHYTKPHFLSATAAVGDSCYSYADVTVLPHLPNSQNSNLEQGPQPKLICLRQQHFNQSLNRQHYQQQRQPDTSRDIVDPSYIYSNAHYSLPLDQPSSVGDGRRSGTPTPPPMPPALPMRNAMHNTTGRHSFGSSNKQKQHHSNNNNIQQQQKQHNTMRQLH